MARYDRDFLVPYLQDICALYLLEDKLRAIIYKYEDAIRNCQKEKVASKPREPQYEEASIGCLGITSLTLAIIFSLTIIPMIIFRDPGMDLGLFFMIPLSVALWWAFAATLKKSRETSARNERKQSEYFQQVREYKVLCDELDAAHQYEMGLIPGLRNELSAFRHELNKVLSLRESAYNANIIPRYYRNKYMAVYLHDWFSTSGADDLDHALSMFVLEEIKARLDRIIEQQSEMILNQRIMIAKQQESIDQQNRHNQMMRNKLDQIQATEEERLRCERMIESNTAVTAYFAAASYLR